MGTHHYKLKDQTIYTEAELVHHLTAHITRHRAAIVGVSADKHRLHVSLREETGHTTLEVECYSVARVIHLAQVLRVVYDLPVHVIAAKPGGNRG